MTDPMPPLALDLWATIYSGLMNAWTGTDLAWITRTGGRLYFELTPMLGFRALRRSLTSSIDQVSEEAAVGAERLFEERARDFGGGFSLSDLGPLLRRAPGALPGIAWAVGATVKESVRLFFEGEAGARRFRERLRDWSREGAAAVLAPNDPKALARNAFAGFPEDDPLVALMPKVMRVLIGPASASLLRALMPEADADLVDAAGRGNAEEVGTRMTLALGDLADTAREAPAVEEAILDEHGLDAIRQIEGSRPFMHRFETFLDDFGHRAAGEFDPSRPRWRHDASGPLGIIRGILRGEEKGAHRRRLREREQKAKEAARALHQHAWRGPFGALRGPLVDVLLRTYRANLPLRDEPKHHAAYLFAAWHEALRRAGQPLVDAGALSVADDVWYLRKGELFALLDDPNGDVPDIEARRAEHERQKRVVVPPLIASEGEAPRAEQSEIGEHVLAGTGVSPGTVEGTARIVHSPAEANLKAGDILVCPSSDPA